MEKVQLNYHQAAEEKGVFIISACGFDSVPVDLGVVYFVKNFPGTSSHLLVNICGIMSICTYMGTVKYLIIILFLGVVNSVESYMACSNKSSVKTALSSS